MSWVPSCKCHISVLGLAGKSQSQVKSYNHNNDILKGLIGCTLKLLLILEGNIIEKANSYN